MLGCMRASDRYRPKRRLIDDVREAPSYYHAGDVSVSPFTPIGQVAHNMPEEGSVPIKVRRKPAQPRPKMTPIVPAGFLSQYNNSDEEDFAPTPKPSALSEMAKRGTATPASSRNAALASSLWGSLTTGRTLYRKDARLKTDHSHTKAKYAVVLTAVAVLIALLLTLGPVPSINIHSPGHGATKGESANGAYTSNFVQSNGGNSTKKAGTSSGANTSKSSGTTTQKLDSSVIGGMGSTPTSGSTITGSTQPVGSTTTTVTGGMGGGDSSVPGIPGVTQPVTITVPGTNVSADGKPVAGTTPIGVTLN